jgi:hypothetical protein
MHAEEEAHMAQHSADWIAALAEIVAGCIEAHSPMGTTVGRDPGAVSTQFRSSGLLLGVLDSPPKFLFE